MLRALIDGDVVIYRAGWASQEEEEGIACARADATIEKILTDTGATEYQVWLSDSLENNFRFKIDQQYKISRQLQPKPKHYWGIKEFLKKHWNAQITEGQEADDALGINQDKDGFWDGDEGGPYLTYKTVLCSIDKDLKQVPGCHYNFVQKTWDEVDWFSGLQHFYAQFLTGDRVDDIIGVKGLGPVKTKKLLESCTNEIELFEKVQYQYKDDERLLRNGQLLWVRREAGQIWQFPQTTSENIIQDEEGQPSGTVDGHSIGP